MERRQGAQDGTRRYKLPEGMYQAFKGLKVRRIGDTHTDRMVKVTKAIDGEAVHVNVRVKVATGIWDQYSLSIRSDDVAKITEARKYSYGVLQPLTYPPIDYILGEILTAKTEWEAKQRARGNAQ